MISNNNKKVMRNKVIEDVFTKILEEKNKGKFEALDLQHLKSIVFNIAKGK